MKTILNALFPEPCVSCGRFVGFETDVPLCTSCREAIVTIGSSPVCDICGINLPQFLTRCQRCSRNEFTFEWVQPATLYDGVAEKTLQAYKFSRRKKLARMMARAMMETAARTRCVRLDESTTLIPVPSCRRSVQKRGFSSALELARALATETGGSIWDVLVQSDAISQKTLGYEDRFSHAKKSIRLRRMTLRRLSLHVTSPELLLVDDVFTTGATLSHCASLLKELGFEKISGLVFTMEQ